MPGTPTASESVVDLLRESWLGRQLRRIERTGEAAFRHSRMVSFAAVWMSRAKTTAGLVLMVAAVTHAGLLLMQGRPAGWLWLVPVAAAAASGALVMTFGRSSETSA
jgi:hypothetical protein